MGRSKLVNRQDSMLKNASYLMLANVASLILVMGSSILLARNLSLDALGAYRIVTMYSATYTVILSMQFQNSILYFTTSEPALKKEWLGHSLGLFALLGLISACSFSALALALASLIPSDIADLLVIYGPVTGFRTFLLVVPIVSLGVGHPKFAIIQSVLYGVLQVGGYVLVVSRLPTVGMLIAVDTVSSFFASLLGFWWAGAQLKGMGLKIREFIPSRQKLRKQFVYSVWLAVASVIKTIGGSADRILASALLAQAVFGLYTTAALENPLIGVVLSSFVVALIPTLAKSFRTGDMDDFWKNWHQSILVCGLLLFPLMWFSVLWSREVLGLVYGEKFGQASSVFLLYSITPIFRCGSFQTVLRAIGETRYHPIAALVSMVCSIAAAFCGFKIWGMPGLAGGALTGYLSYNAIIIYFMQSRFGLSVWKLAGCEPTLKALWMTGIPVIPCLVCKLYLPAISDGWLMLITISIYVITYGIVVGNSESTVALFKSTFNLTGKTRS